MGFETSADSYWTLTKLIVQQFEGKSVSQTAGSGNSSGIHPSNTATNGPLVSDDAMSESSLNGVGARGSSPGLDFMPLVADCDSHGAHLRKILKR